MTHAEVFLRAQVAQLVAQMNGTDEVKPIPGLEVAATVLVRQHVHAIVRSEVSNLIEKVREWFDDPGDRPDQCCDGVQEDGGFVGMLVQDARVSLERVQACSQVAKAIQAGDDLDTSDHAKSWLLKDVEAQAAKLDGSEGDIEHRVELLAKMARIYATHAVESAEQLEVEVGMIPHPSIVEEVETRLNDQRSEADKMVSIGK